VAAADVAKRGDQIIEGVRVLVEQHLAAILGQLAPVIEAGDRRPPIPVNGAITSISGSGESRRLLPVVLPAQQRSALRRSRNLLTYLFCEWYGRAKIYNQAVLRR
jgi:hypothetical protein